MAKSSKRWLQAHRRDQFVKQARDAHYRSRAVYKLQEIDKRDHLFKPGQTVVDLGAAPGGWSQYAVERVGHRGRVIALDILSMEPVDSLVFIQGDFTEEPVFNRCIESLGEGRADLVISDLAPNLTGIRATDQARSMYLAELVLEFACRVLRPGGDLLIKLFQGEGVDAFKRELHARFQKVMVRKPRASRDSSREIYVLARGYGV
jgi:23S rRNA (uridine2552-2'-O)-methyltransferase